MILFKKASILLKKLFTRIFFSINIAVEGAMVRPRFGDNREQKRDSSDSRKPTRDNKRRQEYLR